MTRVRIKRGRGAIGSFAYSGVRIYSIENTCLTCRKERGGQHTLWNRNQGLRFQDNRRNIIESRLQIAPQQRDSTDDDGRDQGDKQSVFNCTGAAIIFEELE